MIYTIGKIKINIPETGTSRKVRTPRQVVPFRDMAETCRTMDALLPEIKMPKKRKIKIIDGIARSGFWAGVFLNKWPDCELLLNECNECSDILKDNFPGCKVESNNLDSWIPPKSDLLLLDFDDFTLRKSGQYIPFLKKVAPTTKWLMAVDSTCFGFKFGNLKHYGVDTEEQYYQLLNSEMSKVLGGKRIVAVSAFVNAAMILYAKQDGDKIKYIPPSELFVARGKKPYKQKFIESKGFGLCG